MSDNSLGRALNLAREAITGWKEYPPDLLHREAKRFWQKRVLTSQVDKISINLYEYELPFKANSTELATRISYMLDIYIPVEFSPTEMSMKIESFSYTELNWELIEEHARLILLRLCPEIEETAWEW